MEKLTKKQRKEIYKRVYEIVEKDKNHYNFICLILEKLTHLTVDYNNFPELFLFKDDNYGSAFLSENGIDFRRRRNKIERLSNRKLLVLGFCIAMCED